MLADGYVKCADCGLIGGHTMECWNGRRGMKSIPGSYCIWCEEKLSQKEYYPYCSAHCRKAGKKAGQ